MTGDTASSSLQSGASDHPLSSIQVRLVSGSIGSVITSFVVHPLEVIKVRLQNESASLSLPSSSSSSSSSSLSSLTATSVTNHPRPTVVSCHSQPTLSNNKIPSSNLARPVAYHHVSNHWCTCCVDITTRCLSSLPSQHHHHVVIMQKRFSCACCCCSTSYSSPLPAAALSSSTPASAAASTTTAATTTTVSSSSSSSSLSTVRMAQQIFNESNRSLSGFYVGIRPTLIMAIPNSAMYMTLYEEFLYRLQKQHQHQPQLQQQQQQQQQSFLWWSPLVAGGLARMIASTVTAPLELLRTRAAATTATAAVVASSENASATINRMHNTSLLLEGNKLTGSKYSSTSILGDVQNVIRTEGGFMALFRGVRATLARDVPFSAVYWYTIEELRRCWQQHELMTIRHQYHHHHHHLGDHVHHFDSLSISPIMQEFCNGAIAGMIAASFTTPFDVVKTRQQSKSSYGLIASQQQRSSTTAPRATSSLLHEIITIAQTEGVGALWSGNVARMLKVAPACAIMISSYEMGKSIFNQYQYSL
jgi:hypothetical protein